MSQRIKVYTADGKVVSSFPLKDGKLTIPNPALRDPVLDSEQEVPKEITINKEQAIAMLNSGGYYIRSQFSKSGKTLLRSMEGLKYKTGVDDSGSFKVHEYDNVNSVDTKTGLTDKQKAEAIPAEPTKSFADRLKEKQNAKSNQETT